MRFINDDPSVSVDVDVDYNPAVRRVEADGRGRVDTSRIDEVVRTNTNCLGSASSARLLDFTIGARGDGQPNFCNFYPGSGSLVRLAAEPGVVVDAIGAFSDWSSVDIEVDESAQPTGSLTTSVASIDVLRKFGTQMDDVHIYFASDDVLTEYFAWLDTEGYTGTVHVNSGDSQQTPVQVYPAVQ